MGPQAPQEPEELERLAPCGGAPGSPWPWRGGGERAACCSPGPLVLAPSHPDPSQLSCFVPSSGTPETKA